MNFIRSIILLFLSLNIATAQDLQFGGSLGLILNSGANGKHLVSHKAIQANPVGELRLAFQLKRWEVGSAVSVHHLSATQYLLLNTYRHPDDYGTYDVQLGSPALTPYLFANYKFFVLDTTTTSYVYLGPVVGMTFTTPGEGSYPQNYLYGDNLNAQFGPGNGIMYGLRAGLSLRVSDKLNVGAETGVQRYNISSRLTYDTYNPKIKQTNIIKTQYNINTFPVMIFMRFDI